MAPAAGHVASKYACGVCAGIFTASSSTTSKHMSIAVCPGCWQRNKASRCAGCGRSVPRSEAHMLQNRVWHLDCMAALGHLCEPSKPDSSSSAPPSPALPASPADAAHPSACPLTPYSHMYTSSHTPVVLAAYVQASMDGEVSPPPSRRPEPPLLWDMHNLNRGMPLSPDNLNACVVGATAGLRPPSASLLNGLHLPGSAPCRPFLAYSLESFILRVIAVGMPRTASHRFKSVRSVVSGAALIDFMLCTRTVSTRADGVVLATACMLYLNGMLLPLAGGSEDHFEDKEGALYVVSHRRRRSMREDSVAERSGGGVAGPATVWPAPTGIPALDEGGEEAGMDAVLPAVASLPPPPLPATPTPTPPLSGPLDKLVEARRALAATRAVMTTSTWREGWMTKQGHKFKNWKRRWFVLQGHDLSYFRSGPNASGSMDGITPAGVVDIREYTLEEAHIRQSSCAMRLVSKRFVDAEFLVYAENESDFVAWVKALSKAMKEWEALEREDIALQGGPLAATMAATPRRAGSMSSFGMFGAS